MTDLFYDVTYVNNTTTKQKAEIDEVRTFEFANNNTSSMSVVRFDISNDLIPAYVPNLRYSNEDYFDKVLKYTTGDNYFYTNLALNHDSTDLFMMVEATNNDTAMGAVKWSCPNVQSHPPAKFTPTEVVQNDYYHSYNTFHIAQLIQNTLNLVFESIPALNTLMNGAKCQLVKETEQYILLIPTVLDALSGNWSLSFNSKLKYLFPFWTVMHDTIPEMHTLVLKNNPVITFNAVTYHKVVVQYQSTSFMRFHTIAFRTMFLPILSQISSNNLVKDRNDSDTIVADFLISDVVNCDTMYDKLTFSAPSNHFRPIGFVNGGKISRFQVSAVLQTIEGYKANLYLSPGRYFSAKIAIR